MPLAPLVSSFHVSTAGVVLRSVAAACKVVTDLSIL
jgi:hypothetical protein